MRLIQVMLAVMICSVTWAGNVSNVTIHGYSTSLGNTFAPEKTLDGDLATRWVNESRTPDNDPFISYYFPDGIVSLGAMTVTSNSGTDKMMHSAVIRYKENVGDAWTQLGSGPFTFDVSGGGVTVIDFGGANAQYVEFDIKTNSDSGTIRDVENDNDGVCTCFMVSFAEVTFEIADGIANAGPDFEVTDTADVGSTDVTLDGSLSDYPGGSIISYSWSIGGTEIATGVNPTVRMNVGVHDVVLAVETNDAQTDSDTVTVTVNGTPISLANAGVDQTVTDVDDSGSENVTLDGSGSGATVNFWEWVEGSTVLSSGASATAVVDLAVGTHNITLNVIDTNGTTDSDDVIIYVLDGGPQDPIADAGIDVSVTDGDDNGQESVSLDGSGSFDPDGTIVSWDWEAGGSTIATGETPSVVLAVGSYVVTLTVTDDSGATATDVVNVNVNPFVDTSGCTPVVGWAEADNNFANITSACMDIIRAKKILFASRSFGLNVQDGIDRLKAQNSMYSLDWNTTRYDVRVNGPAGLPVDCFDTNNFVNYLASVSPYTSRMPEFDSFVRDRYSGIIDAGIVFYHTADAATFPTYSQTMDSLQADFPNIRFLYVTSGYSPVSGSGGNISSKGFVDLSLAQYAGNAPMYDLASILSHDPTGNLCTFNSSGQDYPYMCPEYNINGDNTHPNAAFSEERMGKAMLVLLANVFCDECSGGPSVVGAKVFYNNSVFDGFDAAANAADDGAIATDKVALLAGETATFANYTSYDKGINGVMVDIQDATAAGSISASDFAFKVGNDSTPSGWVAGPVPVSVTVRVGGGDGGSDRVTIVWADGSIVKQWLEVTVLATGNTGLADPEVFYFGNAVGETGNSVSDAIVDATDEVDCRNHPHNFMRPAAVDSVYDINRDGKVNATDEILARNNVTDFSSDLELIVVP